MKTLLLSTVTALALLPVAAHGSENWPTETVKIVVGFTPGGSSDLVARLIAPKLSDKIGASVIVENSPGAASTVAGALVAAAEPDGYTLFLSNVSASGIAPSTYPDLAYDPVADFDDVSLLGYIPAVLLTSNDTPVTSLDEFVEYVRSRPGEIDFGTGGHGTMNHVAGELINISEGLDLNHIAYRGSAEAMLDLLAGEIPFQIDALTQNVGPINEGSVRALAITTPERSPAARDIPTFTELGYPEIVALNWVGISVPAGTPPAIIETLADALAEIIAEPETQARFAEWGMTPVGSTAEEAEAFTAEEVEKWADVVAQSEGF